MKRIACCLFLVALAGGCVRPLASDASKRAPAPPIAPAPVPQVPAVTPEQVNEANAQAKCEALLEELDREEQGPGVHGPLVETERR
jgi:hypothetical protein